MSITLAQLKQHMPGLKGTAEDADLTAMIAQADALLAGACGWPRADDGSQGFGPKTYTIELAGPSALDDQMARLPVGWLESVTSVVYSATWDWASPDATLAEGVDFVVDQRARALRLKPDGTQLARWPEGRTVRVVFTGGWTTLPDAAVAAVAWMARHLWENRPGTTVQSHAFDGQTTTRREPVAVPRHVKQMANAAGLKVWGAHAT